MLLRQGDFLLTTPQMSVPDKGSIYSVNEGNSQYWDSAMTQCADGEMRPGITS